jgi:CRP-like cAMP-binding protein
MSTITSMAAGETILGEGDYGDRMYVVESGAVQVWAKAFDGSDIVLARLEQGAYFGEQAILPRSIQRLKRLEKDVSQLGMVGC